MARWLNTHIGAGIADGVTRRQLFRLAAENRLIADVDLWMQHHEARNATSHIYDEEKAAQVYQGHQGVRARCAAPSGGIGSA